jgi:hypothetical protein
VGDVHGKTRKGRRAGEGRVRAQPRRGRGLGRQTAAVALPRRAGPTESGRWRGDAAMAAGGITAPICSGSAHRGTRFEGKKGERKGFKVESKRRRAILVPDI